MAFLTTAVPLAGAKASTPLMAMRDKADNRDSGVADLDHSGGSASTLEEAGTPTPRRPNGRSVSRDVIMRPEMALKRSTLSNSLLDIHDPTERYQVNNCTIITFLFIF